MAKAEAILSDAKNSSRVSPTHIIWLEQKVNNAKKKAKLVKALGCSYGAVNERQVMGIDLEYQFSALSKCFTGKDLFSGQANLLDWSFTEDQKRLIFYLLSILHRESRRTRSRSIAGWLLSR
jgi:hypothetical protein